MKKITIKLASGYFFHVSFSLMFVLFFAGFHTSTLAQTGSVTVTGTQNNVPISRLILDVAGTEVIQVAPEGNTNPTPEDAQVIVRAVETDNGNLIFATTRRPRVTNPNPVLGTEAIRSEAVQVVRYDDVLISHRDPQFFDALGEAVSVPDIRTYWDINAQPSIPQGERFVDLMYDDQVVTSGYVLYTERFGNSPTDFIALRRNGDPIPSARVVQVRGWQWNTGIHHITNVPTQTQWMVLFSPSIFESQEPIHGIRVISVNEPDGKMVFFVNSVSASPDEVFRVNSELGGTALINVFDNDELNGEPLNPIDVVFTVVEPFVTDNVRLNPDGTVDVLPNTPPGTYTAVYEIRAGDGEISSSRVTVQVIEYVPIANDDVLTLEDNLGQEGALNVLANDTINGLPANVDNIILSVIENETEGILTLNDDGSVDVRADTPNGIYELTYSICDPEEPEKCDQAIVRIGINASVLLAVDDTFGPLQASSAEGVIGNVLINDLLNNEIIDPTLASVSLISDGGIAGISLSASGQLSIPAGLAEGTYTLQYRLSLLDDPENTDDAQITIVLEGPRVVANDDFASINSLDAQPSIVNVLTNDLVDGVPATIGAVILTEVTNDTGGRLILQNDGSVSVAAGETTGVFRLVYQICDRDNPERCDTGTVVITITQLRFDAIDDTATTPQATPVNIPVLSNDISEFGPLSSSSIEIVENALNGTTTINEDGTVTYAPSPNFVGQDAFVYEICTADGGVCDRAEVTITVMALNLNVTKEADRTEAQVGDQINFTISIVNLSSFTVPAVNVVDQLPANLELVSSTPAAGSGGSWTVSDLAAGATSVITVQTVARSSGVAVNRVTINVGDYTDEAEAGPVTITAREVELAISKTSFAADLFEGNEFEYEIRLENTGNREATGITIRDVLPSNVSYVGFSSSDFIGQPTISGATVTWVVPSIAVGQTMTFRIRVRAGQPGQVTNTVDIAVGDGQELISPISQDTDVNTIRAFFIPNVITPGTTDGKNDRFVIGGIQGFAYNKLTVFNRNGDHVFERENYANDWSAEGLLSGSYFYVVVTRDTDGNERTFKGWVQVIK